MTVPHFIELSSPYLAQTLGPEGPEKGSYEVVCQHSPPEKGAVVKKTTTGKILKVSSYDCYKNSYDKGRQL